MKSINFEIKKMQPLNLPDYSKQLRVDFEKKIIFDSIRKKMLKLTPEEWVRQNFLCFMKTEKQYPAGLIAIEMGLTLNELTRRCDIVAYDNLGRARLIVECKAPHIKISQKTFTQIATYNLKLKVDFLIVTNGLNHFCCQVNYTDNTYQFLENIPSYPEIQAF